MEKKNIFAIIGSLLLILLGTFLYQYLKPITLKVLEKDNLGYYFWAIDKKDLLKDKVKFKTVSLPAETNKDLNYQEARGQRVTWIKDNSDVAVLSTDEMLEMEIKYPGAFRGVLFFSDTVYKYATNIVVAKDSKIENVKELAGKTVAFATGTEGYLLEKYLKDSGVIDATLKVIDKKDWAEKLKEGKIDAIWATEPQGTQLEQEGIGRKIVKNPNNNPKTETSGAITYVVAVKSDVVKTNGKKIASFIDALKVATELDEKELRQIMLEKLGASWEKTVNARTFAYVQLYNEVNKSNLEKLINDMVTTGYSEKKVDVESIIYK